jgi:hypothetical protein
MISESAVDSTILALLSSEKGSAHDNSLEELHTMASKLRNRAERSRTHSPLLILHQCNDLQERSRLDDLRPDII